MLIVPATRALLVQHVADSTETSPFNAHTSESVNFQVICETSADWLDQM